MIDCNRGAQAKLRAGEAGEGDVFLVVFVFLFFFLKFTGFLLLFYEK